MDKHMIHIDDLVRQRLDGAEEPEVSGGWLRMKELLDKEMPVQTGTGWGKRRIIGYFAGLLLMTTAGVGGYRYYASLQPGIYASGGGESEMSSESGVTPDVISVSMPAGNARSTQVVTTAANSSDLAKARNGNGSESRTATNSVVSNTNQSNKQHNPTGTSQKSISKTPESNGQLASSSTHQNQQAPTGASNKSKTGDGFGKQVTEYASNSPTSSQTKSTTASAVNEGLVISNLPLHNLSSGSIQLLSTASSANKAMPAPLPVKFRFETIETIEIVHHRVYDANTQKSVFRIDTMPKGMFVVARAVPQPDMVAEPKPVKTQKAAANPKPSRAKTTSTTPAMAVASKADPAAKSEPVPQSSVPGLLASKEESASLASQSTQKSGSGNQFRLWNAEKIEEAINKFKMNLARMQVYPGIMGGINASIFTPNALGGFQMGLTSLFVLNDWWTLMAELKYIHRFNTGSTVHDDYTGVIPGSGSTYFVTYNNQQYKRYEWKDQSVEHYFNFDAVQTLEMPVALRYSWGRVYAMGGMNLMYSLPIVAKEVTHMLGDTVVHGELRPATHDDEKFVEDDAPLIKISDFGSQFGMGYLLGGGFMFTPSVYMDLRVAQTFWTNASTAGEKQISNDLLRTPSVQLSVGYRFGQKPRQ